MPNKTPIATRLLQKIQLVLLIANLIAFYIYFQHAAEIGLAFGRYGADCSRCAWVFRSQWHHLAADGIAALTILPAWWFSLHPGRRWWELTLLSIVPAMVVVIHQYFSGADWLTG